MLFECARHWAFMCAMLHVRVCVPACQLVCVYAWKIYGLHS